MKKFKYVGIAIIAIAIIVGCIFIFWNKKKTNSTTPKNTTTGNEEFKADYSSFDKIRSIQSTSKDPIKNDKIEVVNIDVLKDPYQSHIEATIKNISNETIDGFDMKINLLDNNGKVVSTLSKNTKDKIEPNNTYVISSNVIGIDTSSIVTAQIAFFKQEMTSSMEQTFQNMKSSVVNEK